MEQVNIKKYRITDKIYLGKDMENRNVELDFYKENINFILLAGQTNSGKSIFHNNLYKQLKDKYSPDEIGFVFLDMTRIDFSDWKSEYLYSPVIFSSQEAIEFLYKIANREIDKKLVIHIEECDMVHINRDKMEKALDLIKQKQNIYVVYSTSRIDPNYLIDWSKRYFDLKVFFDFSENDSRLLLYGDTSATVHNHRDRVLMYNNKRILCKQFPEEEAILLEDFKL